MFDEGSDPDAEVVANVGRKFPYSTLGDWVALSDPPLPPQSRSLYWLLRMHVNRERGDERVWPTQASLAKLLGLKKPSDVGKYTTPLVELGAVEVEHVRWGPNRMYLRLIYTVHEAPPDGYTGVSSLKQWYGANPKETHPAQGAVAK